MTPTGDPRVVAALADRYAIERELGQGGMATVYLAQDLKHRRRVAVKVLRPDLAATLGSDRFFREIEVAAQLQHPHILPLLDSGDAGGFLYYVMPFIEGESLRERLARRGELPVNEAIRILSEIVDALAAAHAAGVVHRDIKPDNIMLSGRHALVMDFGVAKAVSEATGRNQLTTAGVALGTPAYMAPEQAAADPHLDHRVDIYAVGVLAYELLTGRPPFIGLTPQQVLAAHVTQAPDPVERYRPGIAQGLSDVVMRCLAKRPADRWQSADDLLNALEPLAMSSGGITPTQTRPVDAFAPPPKQFPRWAAWLAGGSIVAAGAFALAVGQEPPDAISLGQRAAVAVSDHLERWPALTPDGAAVLYTRWGDSGAAIVIQQVNGGTPMVVHSATRGVCCQSISPDGTRLLFSHENAIHVMPTLGGQARKVADARSPGSAWSPDGERVAFAANFDSLVVMAIDGSARRLVTRGREVHSPAWSSDGEWIAFVEGNIQFHSDGNSASSAVMVVPVSGGEAADITGSASHNTSPVWIPGRRSLLYISDREGGRDIYEQRITARGLPDGAPARLTTGLNPERIAISSDGRRLAWSTFSVISNVRMLPVPLRDSIPLSAATPVTTGTQNIESARFSPDGKWLYYDSDRSGSSDIWRMPTAGGAAQQMTSGPAPEFQPQASPDGRFVAFHSIGSDPHNRDVYVLPLGGGPAVQVSTSREDDRTVAWSPDGNALAWMISGADSGLMVSHRRADGSWLPARRYATPPFPTDPTWTSAGGIEMHTPHGLIRIDSATGAWTTVLGTPLERSDLPASASPGGQRVWSSDGRTLYVFTYGSAGSRIVAFAPPDTTRRTVAWADHPSQVSRFSLAYRDGRLYFPLAELRMDVWVAEVR